VRASKSEFNLHDFETIECCRICRHAKVQIVLDLGEQPPANSLYKDGDKPPSFVPLRLGRCESCGTIQLLETVNPGQLFSKYVWLTQTATTAVKYAEVFADRADLVLGKKGLSVLEVGSNDGTFLKAFQLRGHKVLGVDPASNIGEVARAAGVPTVSDFFSAELASKLVKESGKFDLVIARNVLPHVADLHSVIDGIREALSISGVAIFEFHRADLIMEELHYDSIYHEHLYLHSLQSIENIASRYGLKAFDLNESPISGGSFVVYFAFDSRDESQSLITARAHEEKIQVNSLKSWQNFSELSREHIAKFRSLVLTSVDAKKKVVGFGASARSSTLLNAARLSSKQISVIADNNEWKQGLFAPGSAIQIVSPQEAFALKPDVVVLLAWNFKSELLSQLKSIGFHGDVILPLPGMPYVETI
jgi:SAM-dependent methyltransferase